MANSQPNDREAADSTLLPVDNPDNQDERIVTQIMFVVSDLSVDMEGMARVAVSVPDGLEYHKYNLMDTVTLFMRGPKHTYSEMEKLMESKEPTVDQYVEPNDSMARDKPLAFLVTTQPTEESMVHGGRTYVRHSGGIKYQDVPSPKLLSTIAYLNDNASLKLIMYNASMKYKIPMEIIAALAIALSGLNERYEVKHPIRRLGLMQITQSMSADKGDTLNINELLAPAKNIDVGCYFINKHRAETFLDIVKIAAIFGVGSIVENPDSEWGVKEPEDGYISRIVNVYNDVINAVKNGYLNLKA